MKKLFISFVIPMYNEKECIGKLYARILKLCQTLSAEFELIAVNDGSSDNTLPLLKKLRKKNPKVRIISFTRNFGHQLAIMAGLKYAQGDIVVVMDADLQDPPEVIPKMIDKWREGFKVVYGIRENRKENFLKKTCYKLFYRLLLKISPLKNIPLDAGDFCLMDKKVVCEMRKFNEDRPFIRGLRTWVGFKQTGIKYSRPKRIAGKSKYDFILLLQLAFDGLLSFSSFALRIAVVTGFIISSLSIIYGLYTVVTRILIFFGVLPSTHLIPGWATLVASITFLMGLQFIFLGIVGEYVGRIYSETKKRPLFIIEEAYGVKNEST